MANLLDPHYAFQGHGVHTYEHLRALVVACYADADPQLAEALTAYFAKLEPCLTPAGGPIGDEWITGRAADPSDTGYEYCSSHELLDSYCLLLQKSGQVALGDRIERLLFNAALGARHPHESAIAYLKTDNSYSMTGPLRPTDPVHSGTPQTRYKYSPAHQDAAVCCVPNAGRILPYYLRAQWMRTPTGLVAALYGPCMLTTAIDGVAVQVETETAYPYDLTLTFRLTLAQPHAFELAFRKPAWATGVTWEATEVRVSDTANLLVLHKTWQTGDVVRLRFDAPVAVMRHHDGEAYVAQGPLVFALPLEGTPRPGRSYAPGFEDGYYDPAPGNPERWHLANPALFTPTTGDLPTLRGPLWDAETGTTAEVELVPMAKTVLRKVTFAVR